MTRILALIFLTAIVWTQAAADAHAQAVVAATPQTLQLRTGDGVQLAITYYAGPEAKGTPKAKQVTPVVMLHDHKDSRAIFGPLVAKLQEPAEGNEERQEFAVVTVDLRGHGESKKQLFANGLPQEIDAAKLNKNAVYAMANLDMEEVRRFLVGKNDAGELNLNKLCLIGSGLGASVAANWAAQDWLAPPLAIGKQGQDVKALVMISPRWTYEGLTMQVPMRLRPLKQYAAWMLIYGTEDPEFAADFRRINKQLEAMHPQAEGGAAKAANGLEVLALPSKLQGDSLLTHMGDKIEDSIVQFLSQVAKQQQPWIARRSRLPGGN